MLFRSLGNDLINDVLKKITKDTIRALERLFNGEGLRQNISGTSDLSKLLDENTGANSRYPLMSEIKELYLKAFHGV